MVSFKESIKLQIWNILDKLPIELAIKAHNLAHHNNHGILGSLTLKIKQDALDNPSIIKNCTKKNKYITKILH